MKKIILAASLLFICQASSYAQVIYTIGDQDAKQDKQPTDTKRGIAFGPELGLNMANMAVKSGGTTASTSFKAGLAIGGVVDFGFTKNIYLQPGVFFLMNGCNFSGSGAYSVSGSYDINTIQVPINVEYKLNKPGGNRLFFGIGPYIGYNISGTQKTGSTSTTLTIGSDSASGATIKALDFGAGINIGYQIAKGFFARAHYQMGFANLAEKGTGANSSNSMTTSAIGVTIGYLFGGKPVKKPDAKAPDVNKPDISKPSFQK